MSLFSVGLILILGWQEPVTYRPEQVTWTQLNYEGSILFSKLTAEITLSSQFEKPQDLPFLQGQTEIWPASPTLLTMKTRVAGTDGQVWTWFDGSSGRVILGRKQNLGRQNNHKWFRYSKDRVLVQRLGPLNRTEKKDRSSWSKKEQFEYSLKGAGSAPVGDSAALFYLLSASDLKRPGQSFCQDLFAGKELLRVTLSAIAFEEIETSYSLYPGPTQKRKQRLLVIRVDARPAGGDRQTSEFELLGLEEDIMVYLEPETRLPVRIRGKAPFVGTVVINLRKARTDNISQ